MELKQWEKDLLTVAEHACTDSGSEPVLVIAPSRMGKFTQATLRKRAESVVRERNVEEIGV